MTRRLQILALDNPYPPNYGGAVDMFYKIVSLAEYGVEIDLHYYAKKSRIAVPNELKKVLREYLRLSA